MTLIERFNLNKEQLTSPQEPSAQGEKRTPFNRGMFALAFFQAWIFSFFHSSTILSTSYAQYNLVYVVAILSAIFFLMLSFFLRYRRQLRRRMLAVASVFGCAAVAFIYALPLDAPHLPYAVAAIALGAGVGVLIPYIGKLFCEMHIELAAFNTFASFFLSVLLYFLVAGLPGVIGAVAVAAMPLLSATCICLEPRDRTNLCEDSSEEVRAILSSHEITVFLVGVTLLGLLFGLCMSYCGATADNLLDAANVCAMLLLAACALVYLVVNRLLSVHFDFEGYFTPVVPIVTVGLLLFGREALPACVLLILGYQISDMVVWVVCSWIGMHSGLPQRAFCLMKTCMFAGMLAGTIALYAIEVAGIDPSSLETPMLVASGLVISIIALVFRNSRVNNAIKDATPAERPAQLAEAIGKRCAELGSEYLLTAREEEVLRCLVQGRSLPYIEKKLYISHGTANAHRDHIYAKLGIHSKQELLDLFFGIEETDRQ